MSLTAKSFEQRLRAMSSTKAAENTKRFFKMGKGQYGEGDRFIGVRAGQVFALAKAHADMPLPEIERLLQSDIHEARSGALSIMGKAAPKRLLTQERQRAYYAIYLRNHQHINNWDLVDIGAYNIVGRYLSDKPRTVLYKLARSKNMWERRTAIVSTWAFSKEGDTKDAFAIAELLLKDKEDLIHKATGWMLRSAGKIDAKGLYAFLDTHAATMPRTMLRYSIEKFNATQKQKYMQMKSAVNK